MTNREEKIIPSVAIGFYSFLPASLSFFCWLWPPTAELSRETQIWLPAWIISFLIGVGCIVWVFSEK